MPVTLDTRKPDKPKRGSKDASTGCEAAILAATDAAEKKAGLLALGLWLGILALLCLPWWIWESTQPFAIGMPLWCGLSILVFALGMPARALAELRKDPKSRVTTKVRAGLKTILGKVAGVLNAAEPPTFVDAQAQEPRLRVVPGALIFNEPIWKQLNENEINALAVRGIAHQRLGHARRLSIIDEFDKLPSPLFKLLAWPVWIYVELLQNIWLQHALQSADRIALLVVRNFGLLLSAIVKEKAANDANMQVLGVQSSDVANWVAQRGHIGMEGKEISTQYKLGRAIHENPPFEKRILNLQEWSNSKAFESAVEQLAKRR